MLAVLNAVSKLDEMNVPGFDFKPYFNKKQTPGYWSTRVNDYWLLTFRFEHDHAFDVNLQPVFQVINNRSH